MLIETGRPFYLAILAIVIGLGTIIGYQEYQKSQNKNFITIFTSAGEVKIEVEYAETPEKQEKGLMGRASLNSNSGMLFIFPEEKRRQFWMSETLIPLDVLFIDSNGRINEITTLQPCSETSACPIYSSHEPARYTIEVNAGFAAKNRIVEGDILEISGF